MLKQLWANRETIRMRVFGEQKLSEVLGQRRQAMWCEIEREPSNQLLNVNESDFVKHLVDRYRIEPITFAFDAIQVSSTEKLIPAEKHSPDFDRRTRTRSPARSDYVSSAVQWRPRTVEVPTFNSDHLEH